MRKIIITILFFIVNFSAYAQNGWQIAQCYYPASSVIFSKTSNLGIASGYYGFVKKTTDGGLNWKFLFPTINNQYTAQLHWLNDNLVFARENLYNDDTIYKSTNFGNNWVKVNSCPQFVYSQIIDVNIIFGLTASEATIYYSSNAGINWIQKSLPFHIQHMYFSDNLNGWIVDDSSRIAHTTNSGTNWILQQSGVTCYFLDVYFINSSTGWACGDNGKIIKTTNSGNNWFELNSGVNNTITFRQVKFKDSNSGWAIGCLGIFNRTTNGGINWSHTNFDSIPSAGTVFNFEYMGNSNLYIYGINSYFSSNNGVNWVMVDSSFKTYLTGNILNLFFLNQNTGWYCCSSSGFPEYDMIRKTTNGGMNWISMSRNFGLYPERIFFVNEQTGFAAGGGRNNTSGLMKTTNSGINWIYINNGNNFLTPIYDIKFVDINTGYLVGFMGCYKTTNSGINWIKQSNNSGHELSISNNGMFVCYVDDGGTFVLTTNGGINWIDRSNINLNRLNTVFFINSNTGWIGGRLFDYSYTDYFWKTTNAGINWISQDSSNMNRINSIFFINENTGWAVGYKGYNGQVIKTTNGGINWLIQKTGFLGEFSTIKMTSSNEGWISSVLGKLLHTTNGGEIFIKNISQDVPKYFSLSQNCPNPFNPTTKIKFDLKEEGRLKMHDVKLIVYDILGKEIATLVNETLQPGTYEVEFNGENYPSGIYFYQLKAGDFLATNRMILIK